MWRVLRCRCDELRELRCGVTSFGPGPVQVRMPGWCLPSCGSGACTQPATLPPECGSPLLTLAGLSAWLGVVTTLGNCHVHRCAATAVLSTPWQSGLTAGAEVQQRFGAVRVSSRQPHNCDPVPDDCSCSQLAVLEGGWDYQDLMPCASRPGALLMLACCCGSDKLFHHCWCWLVEVFIDVGASGRCAGCGHVSLLNTIHVM